MSHPASIVTPSGDTDVVRAARGPHLEQHDQGGVDDQQHREGGIRGVGVLGDPQRHPELGDAELHAEERRQTAQQQVSGVAPR
jgi:hypothetical protein